MRRKFAKLGVAIAASIQLMTLNAIAVDWTHGTALNATPRMPQGFAHFNYVNPDAPKTGIVRQGALGRLIPSTTRSPKVRLRPAFR